MFFISQKVFILVICIGFLSIQTDKVSGLTSLQIALKDDHSLLLPHIRRLLKVVKVDEMNAEKKPACLNTKFDLNKSSKRRVRRGSDPIHNMC